MARRSSDPPPRPSTAPSSTSDTVSPIGGYVAPNRNANPDGYRGGMSERERSARLAGATEAGYYDGDEYRLIRNMTPAQIARLQLQMAAAGVIGAGQRYIPGNAETTRAAFRDLLAAANGMGTTWQEALRELAASGGDPAAQALGGDGGGGQQLPTYVAPNRADLTAAIRRGLYSQFGTHQHAVDVEAAVNDYLARHRANFDAQVAGAAQVEDVQSVETFVEDRAQATDPTGVEARAWLDRAEQFFSMLSSPVQV